MAKRFQVIDGDVLLPIWSASLREAQQQATNLWFGDVELDGWEEVPRMDPTENRCWELDHQGMTLLVIELRD